MTQTIRTGDLESPDFIRAIAQEILSRKSVTRLRLQTLYSRCEGDSYTIWFELWLAVEEPSPSRTDARAAPVIDDGVVADAVDVNHDLNTRVDDDRRRCDDVLVCHVEWKAGILGEQIIRVAGARLAKELGVPFRLCHEPERDWTTTDVYEHIEDATSPLPDSSEIPFASWTDALDRRSLPRGFVQQLSGINDASWNATVARCRAEDVRTYEVLRTNLHRIDARALVVSNLPGPASVLAALALAEHGWAPTFFFGPELHTTFDWTPTWAALKHVSGRLREAFAKLDAGCPAALIGCGEASTLAHRRRPDETPELEPVSPDDVEEWVREILLSKKSQREFARLAALHRRAIFPSTTDVARTHQGAMWLNWGDVDDVHIFRYENGFESGFSNAGIPVDSFVFNPYATRNDSR